MSYSEDYHRRCMIEQMQEAWNYAETLTAQYDEQTTHDKSIPGDTETDTGGNNTQP